MRWLLLLLVLSGCVVPSGMDAEQPIPEGKGLLVFHWQTDRSVLGSSWAASTADAYELVLVGAANRAIDLTAGNQVVAVDPGTWRVMVLVGVKKTSGSTTAYLVGSALAETVTVTAGQRTAVDLTLKSIDVALTSGPAYWKDTVTVSAAGKSRNSHLGMLLAGSTTSRPRFKSTDLWGGYRECSAVTGTPSDWAADATGTVPNNAAALTVGLVGAGLCFEDAAGTWVPTAGFTKFTWCWPSRAELADTHPLVPYTELAIAAGPPPTGLEISMAWE